MTVSIGRSWKNWKTMPMFRPRHFAILPSLSLWTGVPPMTISPLVGRSMPAIMLIKVDLPRAGLADDADEFAVADGQVHALEGQEVPGVRLVGLDDAVRSISLSGGQASVRYRRFLFCLPVSTSASEFSPLFYRLDFGQDYLSMISSPSSSPEMTSMFVPSVRPV